MSTIERLEDKLVEMKRDHILKAASEVFAEKGFRSATIKTIAKQAGLADGTIYNYFPNKRHLFFSMLESIENPVVTSLTETEDPVDLGTLLNDLVNDGRKYLHENGRLLRSICAEVLIDEELRTEFFIRIVQPRLGLMQSYLRRIDGYQQMSDEQIVTLSRTLLGGVLSNLLFEKTDQFSSLYLEPSQLTALLTAWFSDGVQPKSKTQD